MCGTLNEAHTDCTLGTFSPRERVGSGDETKAHSTCFLPMEI